MMQTSTISHSPPPCLHCLFTWCFLSHCMRDLRDHANSGGSEGLRESYSQHLPCTLIVQLYQYIQSWAHKDGWLEKEYATPCIEPHNSIEIISKLNNGHVFSNFWHMQQGQYMLLFLVLAVNSANFTVTRSYSGHPFSCTLNSYSV